MYIKLILHFRFNWDLKLIEGCATQCAGGRISYEKSSFMIETRKKTWLWKTIQNMVYS
jgi:hypothetical protein